MEMQMHQDALQEILNRLDGISADLTEMKLNKKPVEEGMEEVDPEMGETAEHEASESPAFEKKEDLMGGEGVDVADKPEEGEDEDPAAKLKKIFGGK